MIEWPDTENVGFGTVGVGRGVESVVDMLESFQIEFEKISARREGCAVTCHFGISRSNTRDFMQYRWSNRKRRRRLRDHDAAVKFTPGSTGHSSHAARHTFTTTYKLSRLPTRASYYFALRQEPPTDQPTFSRTTNLSISNLASRHQHTLMRHQ